MPCISVSHYHLQFFFSLFSRCFVDTFTGFNFQDDTMGFSFIDELYLMLLCCLFRKYRMIFMITAFQCYISLSKKKRKEVVSVSSDLSEKVMSLAFVLKT